VGVRAGRGRIFFDRASLEGINYWKLRLGRILTGDLVEVVQSTQVLGSICKEYQAHHAYIQVPGRSYNSFNDSRLLMRLGDAGSSSSSSDDVSGLLITRSEVIGPSTTFLHLEGARGCCGRAAKS
jgi:hypothetical protein